MVDSCGEEGGGGCVYRGSSQGLIDHVIRKGPKQVYRGPNDLEMRSMCTIGTKTAT